MVRREGYVFPGVSLCPHGGGRYPTPRFFLRSVVPGPFLGGPQSWPGGGYPTSGMGVPQSQVLSQVSGPRSFPRGYYSSQDRSGIRLARIG